MHCSNSGRSIGGSARNASRSSPPPRSNVRSALKSGKDVGVTLTRDDVEAAFAFFDTESKGELKSRDLKVRLSAFYPTMTASEYKFLLDEASGTPFTVETLWSIIDGFNAMRSAMSAPVNDTLHFDPVQEAFHIYDPQGSGVVDTDVLSDIMGRIGMDNLSDEEVKLLIDTADFDKDGKVSIDDFKNFLANRH
uniref:EF-hand domain-containing protein n=1 Tax=Trypanosoma congolense (strain IL3000) TaxID=1068625 RepID=G0ULF4_TRYCI|nr:conserved hypothetical protein [Trypanosoma congolense IL3000]